MKILGIETSCDETAVCLIETEGNLGADFTFRVLGNGIASQAAAHAEYGGVFPNLAKREHARNIVPMLEQALTQRVEIKDSKAKYKEPSSVLHRAALLEIEKELSREPELLKQLISFLKTHTRPDIDAIAVTVGPGLEPALWVGVNFARALSLAWNLPIVAANHMEGHVVISMTEFLDSHNLSGRIDYGNEK
ncbi:MAG: O-sialoglycoprotein endopeptidase (Glycoprotease), partial [Candidatus Adlerbacteria bacterium GW2011_GWC1_50_9]